MNRITQTCLLVGLAGLMAAAQPDVLAASRPSTKKPATAPATKKHTIAQNPYLGAIVVDAATGNVLFEDKADAKGYPASMLKLMDLLIILEKIEQKQLTMQDQVPVSAKASHIGGSRVWLAEKESFTMDEMLYALMIQSANDVAAALAEKIAGTTDVFVELMNQRGRTLGMTSTVFNSVHGLPPGAGQQHDVTTARDFALLCCELLKHKNTLRYTAARERPFRPNDPKHMVIMRTHNHLLGSVEGCDGLKTGYITEAGYSIAVTAQRKGQRVIVIVLGSTDRKVRDAKAAELVAKGFLALAAVAAPAPAKAEPVPAPTPPAKAK
ncbi:MAG: D-alanyl-D-alanine carboxypeptidase [Verrucomicrobia bacterium]|nr:D-alanyl-D-alanine carboxypeptidase [Verrucomicrobiota bacterium]